MKQKKGTLSERDEGSRKKGTERCNTAGPEDGHCESEKEAAMRSWKRRRQEFFPKVFGKEWEPANTGTLAREGPGRISVLKCRIIHLRSF